MTEDANTPWRPPSPTMADVITGTPCVTGGIGVERCGVNIPHGQQVKGAITSTKHPKAPSHVPGVLRLGGTTTPCSHSAPPSACRPSATRC